MLKGGRWCLCTKRHPPSASDGNFLKRLQKGRGRGFSRRFHEAGVPRRKIAPSSTLSTTCRALAPFFSFLRVYSKNDLAFFLFYSKVPDASRSPVNRATCMAR